ncbi:MAG: hypothetical protein Q4A34_00975 [Candidatus Saccharibacteria bacterium]|nr:hypothetical protein [Candidatus Saccharibacteria bacterium]
MDTVICLRHLLRLAEAARKAQDDDLARTALVAAEVLARDNPPVDIAPILEYMQALTSRCDHCYMIGTDTDPAVLRQRAVKALAQHSGSHVVANDQKVLQLGPMVRLATAMYVRRDGEMTKGVSVAFVIDEKDAVQFPRSGPLINELQEYFDDGNPPYGPGNWFPGGLAGYRLIAGSVEVQQILPEELQEMSW